MRKYIDILTEGRVVKVSIRDNLPFSVYKNPSRAQIVAMGQSAELRGIIDDSGDVYVWDAFDGTHDDVAEELMVSWQAQFKYRGGVVEGDTDEATENRNFVRAFGNITPGLVSESEILDEMPMQAVTQLGDWTKNSSFKDQDRKLLNNPKAIKKIQASWKYPEEVDYNVVLVNNAEANRYTELGLIGDVSAAQTWLEANMPVTAPSIVEALRHDQVNIIYTNNKGSERVPMTGWIMAHRFGHAVFARMYGKQSSYYYDEAATCLSRYMGDLAQQYGIALNGIGRGDRAYNALNSTTARNLMTAICTFKSARDGNLRNTFEALHELFSQYIFTGKLTFNDIPQGVKVGRTTYRYRGGDDYDHDNRTIKDDLAYELQSYLETAIHNAVGKVFVM